jgi:hypothetical protein
MFLYQCSLVSLLQDLLLKTSSAAGAKLMAFMGEWVYYGPFYPIVDGEITICVGHPGHPSIF